MVREQFHRCPVPIEPRVCDAVGKWDQRETGGTKHTAALLRPQNVEAPPFGGSDRSADLRVEADAEVAVFEMDHRNF